MKRTKLLFILLCASALNGMETEKPPYEETYGSLPTELKQEIISTALAVSNDLPEAISILQKLSVLHGVNYNLLTKGDTLKNALMKKFPTIVKDVIVFSVEQPELYHKMDTIFKEEKFWDAVTTIQQKKILQDNLKNFTILMHILEDQEKNLQRTKYNRPQLNSVANFAQSFETPLAKKYNELGLKLLIASSSTKAAELIKEGADINYSNKLTSTYFTPLSMASVSGHVEMVKLLLNAGANPYF